MTPRYTIAKLLSDGRTAWYWNPSAAARRAGLIAEALGCDKRSAFARAVALNDQWDAVRSKSDGPRRGTVAWGIARYLKRDFANRRSSTQRVYLQAIKHIEAIFGQYQAEAIRVRHARAFYERLCSPRRGSDRPRLGLANGVLRVARILWASFVAEEIVAENVFQRVRLRGLAPREACWTRAQVRAFARAADEIGEAGIGTAALLAFELCQRQGDVLSLTWTQLTEGLVHIRQSKTGAKVEAELPDYLRQRLASLDRKCEAIVLSPDGVPWRDNINTFRRRFRLVADAARLPTHLWFMDLRRSGVTEMADAGASDNEILSVSGHKTREMLKIYARKTSVQAAHGLEKRRQFAVVGGSSVTR